EATPLSPGERVGALLGDVIERQLAEQADQSLVPLPGGEIEGLQDAEEGLLDLQLAEDRRLLGEVADSLAAAPVHGQVGDVGAVGSPLPPCSGRRRQGW